ncbi:hypothetical protein Tco_0578718 [Tanacetum coccineum]
MGADTTIRLRRESRILLRVINMTEFLNSIEKSKKKDKGNPNDDVKMWDVGGDAFDSMEDVGFLEFADLSLDELEFENDLIIDN